MLSKVAHSIVGQAAIAAGVAGAAEQEPESAIAAGAVYGAIMAIIKGVVTLVKVWRARKAKE